MSPTFTTLPLEIRNEIYSHVFDFRSVTPVIVDSHSLMPVIGACGEALLVYCRSDCNRPPYISEGYCEHSDPKLLLALLEVNQKISYEATLYFYANKTFHGEWSQVAAFVNGIGARRREMIRSVKIEDSPSIYPPKIGETLELLGGLSHLSSLCIVTLHVGFKQLQNELIQGGILNIAGKFDIDVYKPYNKHPGFIASLTGVCYKYKDQYSWSCAKGTTQWTEGDRIRIKPNPVNPNAENRIRRACLSVTILLNLTIHSIPRRRSLHISPNGMAKVDVTDEDLP